MRHFEVVVLGSELAGLVAGALLAKGGRRVLHLDPEPRRSSYRFRDLTFFRHLRLFSSWDSSPAQKRVFFDLNLISEMSRRLVALDPSFQVVLPRHRLDVVRDATQLAHEVEREFPGSGLYTADALARLEEVNERIDKLLEGRLVLPPEKWRERRELKRALAEHPLPADSDLFDGIPADHPLRRFSEMPMRFLTRLEGDDAGAIRAARAARQIVKGLFDLPGGIDELKEALSAVIRHFHGEARQEGIGEVHMRWRRITAFTLASGEVVGCEHVVGAERAERLFERLPPRAMKRAYARRLALLRPSHRIYTLNIALRAEGVPEGMGPLGFLANDPAAPLVGENLLLWLLRPGAGELRGLTVACVIPESAAADRPTLRGIRARVLDALSTLVPFLSRHVVHVDVPWEDGEAQGENVSPAREMDEVYTWDGESPLGIAALPLRTPVKNLLLASREVLPGLGLEGEFLAGIVAARLLRTPKERESWAEL